MPYQKAGRMNDMPKAARTALVAGGIVLALAVLVGIFYLAAPRTFLKLVLSREAYAETVLVKNINEDLPKLEPTLKTLTGKHAYTFEGSTAIEFNDVTKVELGSPEIGTNLQNYLNTTSFNGAVQISGDHMASRFVWDDSDATVLTIDSINNSDALYLNLRELDQGWLEVPNEDDVATDTRFRTLLRSSDEKLRDALVSNLKKAYRSVREDVVVKEDKDLTFGLGTKTATGDRTNIVFSTETVEDFLATATTLLQEDEDFYEAANRVLPEDDRFPSWASFQKFLSRQEKDLLDQIEETGVNKVSLDLYIDRRNDIVGFEVLVKRDENDFVARAVFEDDQDRGPAFQCKTGQTTILGLDITRTAEAGGETYQGTAVLTRKDYKNTLQFKNAALGEDGLLTGIFEVPAEELPSLPRLGETEFEITITRPEEETYQFEILMNAASFGATSTSLTVSRQPFEGST